MFGLDDDDTVFSSSSGEALIKETFQDRAVVLKFLPSKLAKICEIARALGKVA
jgi:hypothetical protein